MGSTGCFDWVYPWTTKATTSSTEIPKESADYSSKVLQSQTENRSKASDVKAAESFANNHSLDTEKTSLAVKASTRETVHVELSETNQPSVDVELSEGETTQLEWKEGFQQPKKKTLKKRLIIGSIAAYSVLCALLFILVTVTIMIIWFLKMHYFVREPDTFPYGEVVEDALWYMHRFFFGSLGHLLLATFTTILLSGHKRTQNLRVQHQEKVILFVLVLASILVLWMISTSLGYVWSRPTVENGNGEQTLLPQFGKSRSMYRKCINASIYDLHRYGLFGSNDVHLEINQVRVNLKWMIKVSCSKSSSSSKPVWKFALLQVLAKSTALTSDKDCIKFKETSMQAAEKDCATARYIDVLIYCWLFFDIVGVWFCVVIFYLYLKILLRQRFRGFVYDQTLFERDMIRMAYHLRKLNYPQAKKKQANLPTHAPETPRKYASDSKALSTKAQSSDKKDKDASAITV